MHLITTDFETFYDTDYSLSRMTTEEYVRDPRFQVIGVSTKVDDGPTVWVTGTAQEIIAHLNSLPWENGMLLAHNTMFDGAILTWWCGIKPKALADTLLMSRAVYGSEVSHSLKALAERRGAGVKGTEVVQAKGLRRQDFPPRQLREYGVYCCNDVDLTYDIFVGMLADGFPQQELRLIDLTLRMFTDPVLELDAGHLKKHLQDVQQRKDALLVEAGVESKKDLMSNAKFADLLRAAGVNYIPMKISPTTGKEVYAFAKTDPELRELEDHWNPDVQALVAARLGNKSTLEESRTERFIGIARRGKLPAPIRYYAAHTGRWGGMDKINLQNLPSRGTNAKKIKQSICAPAAHKLLDGDSSQIEARVLAWLAEQDDLVEVFQLNNEEVAAGVPKAARLYDPYKIMAADIYNLATTAIVEAQRFIGKTTILGCGYGMGPPKFRDQTANMGVEMTLDEAKHIIRVYRDKYPKIPQFWKTCQKVLERMVNGRSTWFGRDNCLYADAKKQAILLPSGLYLHYPELKAEPGDYGPEYTYMTRKGRKKIYGGMLTENICQALARIIIGDQMLLIAKKYRVALTVHDSIVACVRHQEIPAARMYMEQCLRYVPEWADGLPVDCEIDEGERYGG